MTGLSSKFSCGHCCYKQLIATFRCSPPKIRTVKIVDNPFDDIVPRITAAEKRAQQKAKEAAQKEREEAAKRKGAKK